MLFFTTTGDSKSALFAAAVDDGFKGAHLTAALVTSRQRAKMPATTCNAATQTTKIQRNIVLLHDEIVPANAPFSLFSDDSAHLLQHFDFVTRSVAF